MNKRYLLSGLGLCIIIFHGCFNRPEHTDYELMTELIRETVIQDSLDREIPINSLLVNYYIYELQKVPNEENYYPPPPRGPNGEPFIISRIRSELKSTANYRITTEDSLSFIKQVTSIKDIKITKKDFSSIIKINNIPFWNHRIHQEQKTFSFLIPIFNDDKTLAWVEYFFNCSSCGYGKNVLFRKINNKWVIIDSYVTWQS
jgi:hypothetical protein